MNALERIVLIRADEQMRQVRVVDDRRDVYTAFCCVDGCKRWVSYWNKSGMCSNHARTYKIRLWRAKQKAKLATDAPEAQ